MGLTGSVYNRPRPGLTPSRPKRTGDDLVEIAVQVREVVRAPPGGCRRLQEEAQGPLAREAVASEQMASKTVKKVVVVPGRQREHRRHHSIFLPLTGRQGSFRFMSLFLISSSHSTLCVTDILPGMQSPPGRSPEMLTQVAVWQQ